MSLPFALPVRQPRRLLLSVHDVTPRYLPQIDWLIAHLERHGAASGVALLVVPDHWHRAPIARDPAFRAWLRDRHRGRAEVILHGWSHYGDSRYAGRLARFKGTHLTAEEGEFLNLGRAEAMRRLHDGRVLLEDIIGARVGGFVAPAWLYSPGTREALADMGFDFAEDHFRVWSPREGRLLARGPVITWASRSVWRMQSSLAFAAVARHALALLPTVRVAVHPGDVDEFSLRDSIRATLRRLRRTHRPARYADLLAAPAASPGASPRSQTI